MFLDIAHSPQFVRDQLLLSYFTLYVILLASELQIESELTTSTQAIRRPNNKNMSFITTDVWGSWWDSPLNAAGEAAEHVRSEANEWEVL